ncbi:hypothetical protein RRG08_006476 [Elysia crispata]|uniref:Nudix hydrolase domain-containing protein n=1 Tax=Elysia crispata TaxID=231223 RepID=A0AAE1CW22_9GAST|nr:hypothetical protein RRG08_006476 [Elysia crispata]
MWQTIFRIKQWSAMEDISDVRLRPLIKSNFLVPRQIQYIQNGKRRSWDGISEYDDVEILLFNTSRNVFVFVKQFRPAVYLNRIDAGALEGIEMIDQKQFPGHLGVTIELCAGIVDKGLSLLEIARAEVLEECGYNVPADRFCKITSCRRQLKRPHHSHSQSMATPPVTSKQCLEALQTAMAYILQQADSDRHLQQLSSIKSFVQGSAINKHKQEKVEYLLKGRN